MRRAAARAGAGLVLTLAVLLAAFAPAVLAQDDAVVERIVVRVDGRPGEAGLLGLIPIKPGDAFSARLVDQAVKQIFKTGLFADVRASRTGAGRIDLVFDLVRKVFIDAVRFRGAAVPAARLREALTSQRPGAFLQEDRLGQAVEEVRRGLRQAGYFDAVVTCEVVKNDQASTAVLVFRTHDWKSYRVGGLEVEWKAEIPERDLLEKMRTDVGDVYVPQVLGDDLQALLDRLARAGYRRAEVRLAGESFDDQNRRVDLRVEIVPQEKIAIQVLGAKVPVRLLEPIWAERVFEQWGLAEGEARILNYVRRKGYLFATVRSRVERGPNETRIVHEVVPGKKSKIMGVDFRGNTAFSSFDLKTRLAVRAGVPLFSFLSYDRVFGIPRQVEEFYKENGFADVQVRLDLAPGREGVQAVMDVQEGPRTTVEAIRILGAGIIPAAALLRELVSREGGAYFPPDVQRDVSQIETSYLNRGVRGTEVTARIERSPEHRVTLVYEIDEGAPVAIRDVFLAGNRVTRPGVVRRELRVGKGDPADYSRIQASKRRLEALGIFSEVQVDEVQTEPSGEVVVVKVREGEKNYAGVGLGVESKDPVIGSLAGIGPEDFRLRGTAEYIRSNVFGLGAQAGLVGQTSVVESRAVLSWTQPYFFGLSLPMTVLAWVEREDRTAFVLDRRGVSLSAVKALSRSRLILGSLSLTRTSLPKTPDLATLPEDVDRQFLPYSAALASVSMSWERRDDTLNPTRGWFLSAVGEVGLRLFGTESDYQKIFLKGQYFRPLTSTFNLGLTARLGLANGLSHLPERFFAGGSNTFRGEEFEMLGPISASTTTPITYKPYGGEALLLINTELTFPVFRAWRTLRLAAFFDLGNVYAALKDFRPFTLQGAVGGGIRYKTALGPIRLEMAWKLWDFDLQDKRRRPLIFLTIGNIF
ncbi:MAG TPA: POTRA domain-containing protein [Candidatus Aminicenantes bacterium]|nr:POTRA domain-containing protein [Candidatus Aminicenantes bacterium]HRY65016.1 POTRA domain-containing protein [Candidatus Aminicenantes bacterium]HRZ71929.1 POTRA domain-containing protein [Candidatus Aminicenantes bacterium]